MSLAIPAKEEAQNITSADLLDSAASFLACRIVAPASRLETASLTRRRRSCRSKSLSMRAPCYCGLRLNNLARSHDHATGHPHHCGPLRDVTDHQGVGCDLGAV